MMIRLVLSRGRWHFGLKSECSCTCVGCKAVPPNHCRQRAWGRNCWA